MHCISNYADKTSLNLNKDVNSVKIQEKIQYRKEISNKIAK